MVPRNSSGGTVGKASIRLFSPSPGSKGKCSKGGGTPAGIWDWGRGRGWLGSAGGGSWGGGYSWIRGGKWSGWCKGWGWHGGGDGDGSGGTNLGEGEGEVGGGEGEAEEEKGEQKEHGEGYVYEDDEDEDEDEDEVEVEEDGGRGNAGDDGKENEDDETDTESLDSGEVDKEDRPEGHPLSPPAAHCLHSRRTRTELDTAGVAFLDGILEADEGSLVEIGGWVGGGAFGVVRDMKIVDPVKHEAALRFSGGQGFVVKGPKQVCGHSMPSWLVFMRERCAVSTLVPYPQEETKKNR